LSYTAAEKSIFVFFALVFVVARSGR